MRATLQHAGTGLWLDAVLSPERSDTGASLPSALDALETTCRKAGLARDQVVLRTDGCGGNVPFITACRKRQTPLLVRSARYGLLEPPAIIEALCHAAWYEVPSSGSGPTRLAAELGDVLLQPSKNTTTDEGERFEAVRVGVSRFATAQKSGAGSFSMAGSTSCMRPICRQMRGPPQRSSNFTTAGVARRTALPRRTGS